MKPFFVSNFYVIVNATQKACRQTDAQYKEDP